MVIATSPTTKYIITLHNYKESVKETFITSQHKICKFTDLRQAAGSEKALMQVFPKAKEIVLTTMPRSDG